MQSRLREPAGFKKQNSQRSITVLTCAIVSHTIAFDIHQQNEKGIPFYGSRSLPSRPCQQRLKN